jgi:Family of unknown function (DUF5403)
MVQLIGKKAMNLVVSHLGEVKDAVHHKAKSVGDLAKANLEAVRGTTHWHKIYGPSHLTEVTVTRGETDSFVNLDAPNPMAIEYGHRPSGVFGPGGSLGHIESKSPRGLHILGLSAALAGRE